MKTNKHVLPLKRKRLGKTDYRLRLRLVSSRKPRLVIRRSLKNILLQLVQYHPTGDKIFVSAEGKELKMYGWQGTTRNTPVAYLTGYLLGCKVKKQKVATEAVLDIGLYKAVKGSLLFAAAKGAADAGLAVPFSADILPSQERIQGKHLKQGSFDVVLKTLKEKFKTSP